jgi:hypothetical protein
VTATPDGRWVTQQARNLLLVGGERGAAAALPCPGPGRQVLPQLRRGRPLGRWRGAPPAGAGTHGKRARRALVRTVRAEGLDWLLIVGRDHLEQVMRI